MTDRLQQQKKSATPRARLPGLPVVSTGNPSLDDFLNKVRERLEVREGQRGNPYERAVTLRDLQEMGLAPGSGRGGGGGGGSGAVMVQGPDGIYRPLGLDAFIQEIHSSKLYRDLIKRLDDQTRFDDLPEQVRKILLTDLHKLASELGAQVRRLESTTQNDRESFAAAISQVTAALGSSTAAVQQTAFAHANNNRAVAGLVNQVTARLDGFDGGTSSVEEVLLAVADLIDGLRAQWVMKVNAGGAFAAIGLAATESTAGVTDSAMYFLANRFAFLQPSDVVGTGPGEFDPTDPPLDRMPFGIDSSGTIYLNGQVRINALGSTLDELAAVDGLNISATSSFWKVDTAGAAVNSTITLTAGLSSGLTGFVTWTKSGAGTAPPAAGTTNTWTINAADQTDDANTYTATLVSGGITYTDSLTVVRLRDGSSAITAQLDNQSCNVPASTAGVVSSFANATGTLRVYRGTTLLTTGVAFAIKTGGNPDGLTASIHATTGVYSVTAAGSWANADNSATITFEATVGGVAYPAAFTVTKSLQGATGAAGAAGNTINAVATSQVFSIDAAGTPTPATITVSASRSSGINGSASNSDYVWSVTNGTFTGALTTVNSTTGAFAAFAPAAMTTDAVTFRCTYTNAANGLSYVDDVTVTKLREGSSGLSLIQSNESHNVPANSAGAVTSFAGANTALKIYQGTSDITSTYAWSKADTGVTSTLTGSGTGTVTDTVTAMSADVGYVDITATRTGYPTLTCRFTVTKSKAGIDGTGADGARGSLTGYGSAYSIFLSGTWADGTGTTNGNKANAVVWNMLNGTSLTTQSLTSHLRIGDTVTLADAGATTATTKYWSGASWVAPGVIINGNLLVNGTVSGNAIFGGVIGGTTIRIGTGFSSSGFAFEVSSTGVGYCDLLSASSFLVSNTHYPASPAITASSGNSSTQPVVSAVVGAGAGTGACGVEAGNNKPATPTRAKLATDSYSFFADTGWGKVYVKDGNGPFTGFHDALLPLPLLDGDYVPQAGDIVVDDVLVSAPDVNNALFTARPCTEAGQQGAIGVISDAIEVDAALATLTYEQWWEYQHTHCHLQVNAVGEGQINVCGRGGPLARGDLIECSDLRGKGQRQADDIVRSKTVAKVRCAVTFSGPDEVKLVPCIYLCG